MFCKGKNNPRWNGGTSEYPNHAEMKRVRKEILKKANYLCYFCGGKANEIHHKDLSKNNHFKENLVACCYSCNHLPKHTKAYTSKYKRIYGKKAEDIAKMFDVSQMTIINWHRNGVLMSRLESREVLLCVNYISTTGINR